MKFTRLAVMASAAAFMPASVSATTFTVNYSGTLNSFTDTSGIFGTAGATIASSPFSASFTIDTADGTYWNNSNGSGWTQNSLASSNVTTTINGRAFTLATLSAGSFQTPPSWQGSFLSSYTGLSSENIFVLSNLYFYTYIPGAFPGFGTNFDITAPAGSFTQFDGSLDNDYFSGVVTNVRYVNQLSAVPEPASWAMMLTGFGMLGWAMRRARRQTVRYSFA